VVGESGSGKSVLARSVMRLLEPPVRASGTVVFDGRDLSALSPESLRRIWGKDISLISQDPMTSLNPVRKIGRQITETVRLHGGLRQNEAIVRAIELLTMVGIPDPARHLRSYPHELSGGMRQRVAIAIAISSSPRLLIADEPTTALDVTIQRQILDLLSGLREKMGMALILITHDLGIVAQRSDRVMVMYGGRVAEVAPTRALFERPSHPYTASLLAAIPRLSSPSHTRLPSIPGQPVDVIDPVSRCRFAPRCQRAQPRCLVEDPPLEVDPVGDHACACFYPVGTARGDEALQTNLAAGHNAAGARLDRAGVT
jgi:peptide/nickel transport system ATP-binding protein